MDSSNGMDIWSGKRAALVIGHPGHELRLHGWLEVARPDVVVLTDGSGGAGVSRLASCERVLEATGSEPASVFGEFTDRRVYDLILNHRLDGFIRVVDRLISHWRACEIDYVVGDAYDSSNPIHDLCRLLIGAALEKMRRHYGIALPTYDFTISGPWHQLPTGNSPGSLRLRMDEDAYRRKWAAAHAYRDLSAELRLFEQRPGTDSFREECLRPVAADAGFHGLAVEKPYYEIYGEQQVASGRYREVLRYARHLRPLADMLWRYATTCTAQRAA